MRPVAERREGCDTEDRLHRQIGIVGRWPLVVIRGRLELRIKAMCDQVIRILLQQVLETLNVREVACHERGGGCHLQVVSIRFQRHVLERACLIQLEMRKWGKNRVEEILVSNSSLVSGLSDASGVKFSWVEVSQESLPPQNKKKEN